MRFALLGSLSVVDDAGAVAAPGGARQRALLACLLVHANAPVSYDALAEAVWDGRRAAGSAATVRSVVMRLRRALGPGVAARIAAHPPGYLIRVGAEELDTLRFEALCREAGSAVRAGAWADAARAADEALDLWRGQPLEDVPCEALRAQVAARFGELRLQALEDGAQAGLHLGRHEQLVPRLRGLAAQYPLRERLHGQLMLALARCGRRGEALEAYRAARRALVDELGIEPGPELRELHARILAGEVEAPAIPAPSPTPVSSALPAVPTPPSQPSFPRARSWSAHSHEAPRQLPAGLRHFVGRAEELKALSELQAPRPGAGGAVVICAIGGTAGVGKTALAVHWAHQAAERFPDGQLYVNLHGFDPCGTPTTAAEAARGFLEALGVSPHRIPADSEQLAALYRSELADRRVLIVLDNARDADQVRPLLPGSPGCLVLVTSRNQLTSLIALHGAVPLSLDLLTRDEARELLARRLGRERVLADERAVDELIRACARLPLALNIAAARATFHPGHPLAGLVEALCDARHRLDALAAPDGAADPRAVFFWSYRTLSPDTARVFRLLGLHPGGDIGVEAAASLTALSLDHTRRALDELTRAHLLAEHTPGRYAFHDLLRAYAAEQAHAHDTDAERQDALRRVFDFYIRTARSADRVLDPHRRPIALDPPVPGAQCRELTADPASLAWLDAEQPNLTAALRAAAERGWHLTVWRLAWVLSIFHTWRGLRQDELAVWRAAVDAAGHLPDPAARSLASRWLGRAYADLGRHDEAVVHLHRALAESERHEDRVEQAHTHRQLALAWQRHGDDRPALRHATCALDLFRALGEPVWEARMLGMVGWAEARLGEFGAARTHCLAALTPLRQHNDRSGVAIALDGLGYIEHRSGRHQQAVHHYEQALALFRGLGNICAVADTLDRLGHPQAALSRLGHPHATLGRREQARATWRQAFDLYQQQGRTRDAERVERQLNALDAPGAVDKSKQSGASHKALARTR